MCWETLPTLPAWGPGLLPQDAGGTRVTHGDMCSAALYCGLSFVFWVFRSGFVSEHVCAHDIPVFGTLTVLRRDEDRQRGGQGAEGSRRAARSGVGGAPSSPCSLTAWRLQALASEPAFLDGLGEVRARCPRRAPRPSEARLWAQSVMSECLCLLPHCPALRTASPFRSLPHVSGNSRNRSRRPDGSQDPERPRRWGRGVRRGFVAAFELLSLAVPAVTRQATASRRASRKLARLLTRKCTFHPASKMKHRKPKRACGCALLPRFWGPWGVSNQHLVLCLWFVRPHKSDAEIAPAFSVLLLPRDRAEPEQEQLQKPRAAGEGRTWLAERESRSGFLCSQSSRQPRKRSFTSPRCPGEEVIPGLSTVCISKR